MDPIASAIVSLINAVQGAAQADASGATAAPVAALIALLGQEVSLQYLGPGADGGLLLQLPSGQTVTAQGQLPYADGTQLLVRVLPGSGADAPVRLQTLQALPPATPAILQPLYQGEAAGLQAQLQQPDPPAELAPLVDLFRLLGGGPAQGQTLPDPEQIQSALDTLPADAQASLQNVLAASQVAGQTPGGAPSLAASLAAWLASPPGSAAGAGPTSARPGELATSQDPVQRLQAALDAQDAADAQTAQPDRTAPAGPSSQAGPSAMAQPAPEPGAAATLIPWLRRLLAEAQRPGESMDGHPLQALQTLLGARGGPPAAVPESWETWIRGAVHSLSSPATAPAGAAFHAAQAMEGTAFYEVPLPWAPDRPLQIWLEADREPAPGRAPGDIRRVLLGLSFTRLGETRLGIAQGPGALQVRVWTEHPELLDPAARAQVEADLNALGARLDLKFLPLEPGPGGTIPTLRGQITGTTLQAMG